MQYPLCFQNFNQQTPVAAYLVPGQGVTHLVIHGENQQPWHSYSAPTADMVDLLRDLLHQVETIQAGGNPLSESETKVAPPGRTRLAPDAPRWDWLTPEMVIAYFEQSPVLRAVANDVRAALGKAWSTSVEAMAPRVPSPLELDLETIRPHLDKITAGGKINKSEIARVLGLPTGGSGWGRVQAVAGVLSSSSTSTGAPPPAISDQKNQSEAA